MMSLDELVIIPIKRAVMCSDCFATSNTPYSECPACGSIAVYSLRRIFEPKEREGAIDRMRVSAAGEC